MTRKTISFISDTALAQKMTDAADEVPYLLQHAADVFALIHVGAAGGWLKIDDPGVIAVCDLCERAFRNAAEKEGALVSDLAAVLRAANKEEAA